MAVDFFLKIDGIDGESAKDGHKKDIDVLSWSWGVTQMGSFEGGGGGGAGKASPGDFHFTMLMNNASPKLMLACSNGEHIGKAVAVARKAGKTPQEYLKITMSDILMSSYQTGGSSGSDIPQESVSFNFAKIEFEYKEQTKEGGLGGAVKGMFNYKEGK